MSQKTKQKVWFITGCSRGFGWALVEQLLNDTNDLVVATARKPEILNKFKKEFGDRILALKLDVTKQSDVDNAVSKAIDNFGRIDVLVNNAGYCVVGALEECNMKEIRDNFETNFFGLIAVTKAILPHMRSQESGYIMNFSSIAGLVGTAGISIYCGTKFAIEGLSESLALEVANFGIKLTIIEPGPFRTECCSNYSIRYADQNPDYDNSESVDIRGYLRQADGNQVGDPVKAVKIMIQLAGMKNPPLRMLLGNPAIEMAKQKLESYISELREYEELTRSADFE